MFDIEYGHGKNPKAKSNVTVKAYTEDAAKHKFYAKHPYVRGYYIISVDEMRTK